MQKMAILKLIENTLRPGSNDKGDEYIGDNRF